MESTAIRTGREGLPDNQDEKLGEGVGFERIRRITGYLGGTTDRFNNAKQHEEKDRVKHSLSAKPQAPAAED